MRAIVIIKMKVKMKMKMKMGMRMRMKMKNDDDDYEIKQINNCFKMIDETKSFEDQTDILKNITVK